MAKWFAAVILAVAFVAEANADPKTGAANIDQSLPELLETRCRSLQLFAAKPGDEQMKWVTEIPYDVCVKYHQDEFDKNRHARTKYIFETIFKKHVNECVGSKQYPSDEYCTTANMMAAVSYYVSFEFTGNVCARFAQEHAGNEAFHGVCVPYEIPSDQAAGWKEILSVLYSRTNMTPKADGSGAVREEKFCTSAKADGAAAHLIDAVRTVFAQDKTAEAVFSHLQDDDFECTQDEHPANHSTHECYLTLDGFRFSKAAAASNEVKSGYFSDSLSVSAETDANGGAPNICTRMTSEGP